MGAIIRHTKTHILVLCPLGHLIESHKHDRNFGGSSMEAELTFRHEGDRFDRLAARCNGYGHGAGETLPSMVLLKSGEEEKGDD